MAFANTVKRIIILSSVIFILLGNYRIDQWITCLSDSEDVCWKSMWLLLPFARKRQLEIKIIKVFKTKLIYYTYFHWNLRVWANPLKNISDKVICSDRVSSSCLIADLICLECYTHPENKAALLSPENSLIKNQIHPSVQRSETGFDHCC